MSTLQGISIVVKREMKSNFSGTMIYIFTAIFSFAIGAYFYNNLLSVKEITNITIVDQVLRPTFSAMNFLLMFFAPMITMGAFVREKRDNTLVLLKLSKLSLSQIFFSKYIASVLSMIFIILPTLIFPIILSFSGFNDWSMVFTNYLGVFGLVLCYLVVGVFSSLLTKNYIISIVTSFGILFSFLMLLSTASLVENRIVSQILSYMSIGQHFFYFSQGAIVSYDLIYFASFVGFFSYISIESLRVKK